MFLYAIFGYQQGGSIFFVMLQILVAVSSILMMLNTPDKVDVPILTISSLGLIIWSLYLLKATILFFYSRTLWNRYRLRLSNGHATSEHLFNIRQYPYSFIQLHRSELDIFLAECVFCDFLGILSLQRTRPQISLWHEKQNNRNNYHRRRHCGAWLCAATG